jgi:hypothetical protein
VLGFTDDTAGADLCIEIRDGRAVAASYDAGDFVL